MAAIGVNAEYTGPDKRMVILSVRMPPGTDKVEFAMSWPDNTPPAIVHVFTQGEALMILSALNNLFGTTHREDMGK